MPTAERRRALRGVAMWDIPISSSKASVNACDTSRASGTALRAVVNPRSIAPA
jgi:hypothetical protein